MDGDAERISLKILNALSVFGAALEEARFVGG